MEGLKEVEATGKMFKDVEFSIFVNPNSPDDINAKVILEEGNGILGFEEIPTLFSKHSIISIYKFIGNYFS